MEDAVQMYYLLELIFLIFNIKYYCITYYFKIYVLGYRTYLYRYDLYNPRNLLKGGVELYEKKVM